MRFFRLVLHAAGKDKVGLAITALLCGIFNAGLVAVINAAAHVADPASLSWRDLALFLIAFTGMVYTQKQIFERVEHLFQGVIEELRVEMAEAVASADLRFIERMGGTRVYNRVSQEIAILTEISGPLAAAFMSLAMVFFIAVYIAFLNKMAFFMILVVLCGAVLIYLRNAEVVSQTIEQRSETEIAYLGMLTHLVDGFKELKLTRSQREDVLGKMRHLSGDVKDLNISANLRYAHNYIFSNGVAFILIGTLIFVLPRLVLAYGDTVAELSASVLFLIGPLGNIVSAVPVMRKGVMAADHVLELKDELAAASDPANLSEMDAMGVSPGMVSIDGGVFVHRTDGGEPLFTLGPVDVDIRPGEITFIVGGNGSGKSTLLKVLMGLYPLERGQLSQDGKPIRAENLAAYREQFAAVLADFHLFDELYGLDGFDRERAQELLRVLSMDGKTSIRGRAFTNMQLSTGQKKRLGLVVALLRNKEIYVFDEWTADQDSEFRDYFYRSILPTLKAQGKALVVVTHDERYEHMCDHLYRLDLGRIVARETPPEALPPPQ